MSARHRLNVAMPIILVRRYNGGEPCRLDVGRTSVCQLFQCVETTSACHVGPTSAECRHANYFPASARHRRAMSARCRPNVGMPITSLSRHDFDVPCRPDVIRTSACRLFYYVGTMSVCHIGPTSAERRHANYFTASAKRRRAMSARRRPNVGMPIISLCRHDVGVPCRPNVGQTSACRLFDNVGTTSACHVGPT